MPSDSTNYPSHESGVFHSAHVAQPVSRCNVSSKCRVAVSFAPSVVSARLRESTSVFPPRAARNQDTSYSSSPPPPPASVPVEVRGNLSVSKEPKCDSVDAHDLKDSLLTSAGSSPPWSTDGDDERSNEVNTPSHPTDGTSASHNSKLLLVSEFIRSHSKRIRDVKQEKNVLLIDGDLLIAKTASPNTDKHSDTEADNSEKSGIPLTLANGSLTIKKIGYKCKVLQEHSKACDCGSPRLHVYLSSNHRCSKACRVPSLHSSTTPHTRSFHGKATEIHSDRSMTGKFRGKCRGRKAAHSRTLSEKPTESEASPRGANVCRRGSQARRKKMPVVDNREKEEPESQLLEEGECVWLPTIMGTLSGDVEYVVLDDDTLNFGTVERPASPASLKSKINTIYQDIDEKPDICGDIVLPNTKETKPRLSLSSRRLSGSNCTTPGVWVAEKSRGEEEKTNKDPAVEQVLDDPASSSLAEVCTNHTPSIKDIFGDVSVKEEPVDDVKEDMSVEDFSKEIRQISAAESSLPHNTYDQAERAEEAADEGHDESSNSGLFAKLIKEENDKDDEANIDAHSSDDSLGPLQIDEKFLPSPEDASLSLVNDVVELNMPSVNIISPFKIKILLGSPNRESYQVQGDPTPQVGPSDNSLLRDAVKVKNGVAVPKKSKRGSKKGTDTSAGPDQATPTANTAHSIRSLTCIYCHTSCPNGQALAEHFENHQKDGLIICYFCQKSFGDKTGMKRHMRTHTGEKPYQCKVCGKRFSLPGNFKKHRDIHEDRRTEPCSVCGKTFRRKEHLKYHMRTHTGEKPFTCSECGTSFTARYSLQIHMNIHLGKKPYKCTYCSKAFSDKSTMRKHVRVHTGEKPFRCQECRRCFGESGTLAAHMATHRSDRPYQCDKCELRFKTTGGLRQHEKVHSGEKQFACKFCGMKFLQKYNMTMHERIHTGEKPYTCSHCDRSFRSRSCLAKHVVLHGGDDERRFGCDYCNNRFYRKAHLRRHIDMHLGIKNYECETCQKKFCTRGTLKSHLKTFHSHGARRFPCNWCGRVFKRKVYVSTHVCANNPVKGEDGEEAVGATPEDPLNTNSSDSDDSSFEVKSEPEDSMMEDDERKDVVGDGAEYNTA